MNYHYIAELTKLLGICKLIIEKASDVRGTNLSYSTAYVMIFSAKISRRVYYIANQLGGKLDYSDSDSYFEYECRGFINALEDYINDIAGDHLWSQYDIKELYEALPEQEE